jgi:ATP-binding cassette, subfamily B, bacterial
MRAELQTLWRLMPGQRLRYLAAIGAMAAGTAFMYLVPLVPQVVIDGVLAPAPGTVPGTAPAAPGLTGAIIQGLGGREFLAANLWVAALAIIVLTSIAGVFTYLRGYWSSRATESIARGLRDRLYDHLQHLPATFHDRWETGDVVQRCTSDVETVRMFLSTQVVEIGRALLMLFVPLPLMLALDAPMTLINFALVPPIVLFAVIFFMKIKAQFQKVDEAEGVLSSTLQENLTGIRVVRAFARQDFEIQKFAARIAAYRDHDYRMYSLMGWFFGLSDFLCFAQRGLVLAMGTYWLATGRMTVGTLYFFLAAVTMFIWPVRHMGRVLTDLGKAIVALGRIHAILSQPVEHEPNAAERSPLEALTGAIRVRGLSFDHQSATVPSDGGTGGTPVPPPQGRGGPVAAKAVLRDLSFDVRPGETLALLGPSGAGKSTLMHLLLRLYDYDRGSIQLDGVELRDLPRAFVRGRMGVVMQEPFLYSKTLRENLTLGRSQATEGEVIEAAAAAAVHESIMRFERGYDTLVGERGVTLSGGQRQRVALARALLQQPAILILDDALSAVDTRTESLIIRALQERRGRQTTLVIAHRLSTLMHADRVLVLDKGRIVQSGSHDTLVREPGMYQNLWRIQTALEEDLSREMEVGTVK